MRRLVILLALAAPVTADVLPFTPGSPAVEKLLYRAESPSDLRARLIAFANASADSEAAGEAWYWIGLSFDRGGLGDSAIASYERAVAARGAAPERDGLSEALLARGRPADLRRAREVLDERAARARTTSEIELAAARGRIAWSFFLAGQADTAAKLLIQNQRHLFDENEPLRREWRYRLGAAELDRHDHRRAIELLTPIALDSRLQDRDVLGMLQDAAAALSASSHLMPDLQRQLQRRDQEEGLALQAVRGKRVRFAADDGFPLSGVVLASPGRGARRAMVAVMQPGETFDSYDSLAAGLRRAGWSLLLMDPRGSGHSVAATVPLPETWRTREQWMQSRVARDVRHAVRALAQATPVDTSAIALIGAGITAPIAVEAASLDPRVRLLVLISPLPSPVDRGETRARLTRLGLPVFFQSAAEDFVAVPVADTLFHAVDQRVSRLTDSERMGRGARVFRHDPKAVPRFTEWLAETWSGPSVRRAARSGGTRSR